MIKKILMAIVILVVVVLGYAATKPDTFNIERSTNIKAPPEKIFGYLNDFKKATEWVPFDKKDPAMKRQYSGAPSGKGAVYEFQGNRDVGVGRIEIVESTPSRKVTLQLDMREPFVGRNIVDYVLEPSGDTTKMTWTMRGSMPYIAKVVSIFCNMESLLGKDFEAGLATLKTLAEK